ncbi:chemotaxis protein CheX [Sulfurimonas sp.]|nr:chemotaxis protein CheX [Sulfurimonas sp.]
MRPVVKDGIGVFSPQGFLDGNSGMSFMTGEDLKYLKNLSIDMLLVSLKNVIFFNHNGLDTFVKLFEDIRKDNHAMVGFCDYDTNKFNAIQNFYPDEMNFSLFKSLDIAYLFSSSFKESNKNILVYSHDKSQRSMIAIELHDNGHNPTLIDNQSDYNNKKDEPSFDYTVDSTFIGQMGQKIASKVSGNAIIYTITSFLDADINDKFNNEYHTNSLNVGFRLFIFESSKVISMNVPALNFFSKLSSSAAEYNATICFVGLKFDKTPIAFKENLEDSGILFYDNMEDILENKELLEELGASSAANIKNKRVINKKTVAELPRFVDATVATIEMMTNSKAQKESVEIKDIVVGDTEGKIASSIGYYGDMDGMVILVFPKEIAKQACELLIGESTDDMELILDTLAELGNIVAGKIKTMLSEDDIKVNITLPRTYQSIESLLEVIDGRKGVQVDLSFNNDEFLFFLTR